MKSISRCFMLIFAVLLTACMPIQPPAAAPAAAPAASEPVGLLEELGTVNFPVSCSAEAQTEFNHGVALLHSFWFGPEYDWRAEVVHVIPGKELTWKMTQASENWMNTSVGFSLTPENNGTKVVFSHKGWASPNEHFAITTFCWGSLLMGLKNYVEKGVVVPFGERQ